MAKETNKKEMEKKKKGETFYKALPTAVVMPREIHLPKINAAVVDFLESIVIFSGGTVLALLLLRTGLILFGVGDVNLLTYLLYASSYPSVALMSSSQGQIPAPTNDVLYETISLMVIYFVFFYLFLRILKALKNKEEVRNEK